MTAREPGPAGLEIALDRGAEVPIGVQLAWALRSRILHGTLAPHDRLPALRDLAGASGVNVNTVRAVYQRLEREGLVETRQGSGTFVSSAPQQTVDAVDIAASAAREAQEAGVDPRDVAAALYVGPATAPSPRHEDLTTGRRRQLRRQIGALEQALAAFTADHPQLLAALRPNRRPDAPRLLGTEELEAQQAELIRQLAAVQEALAEGAGSPASPGPAQPGEELAAAPSDAGAKPAKARRPPPSRIAPA